MPLTSPTDRWGRHVIERDRRPKPLAAKLAPPRVEQASVRPDTLTALERACRRRLTLVCAPAGYGKTTTIAAAFQRLRIDPVWYKLDVLDHDPVVFLGSLVEAFRRRFAGFGQPIVDLLRFVHESPVSTEHLLALFLDECSSGLQPEVCVVIDDYHEAADSVELNRLLVRLLGNAPENLAFVILSRYDVAFPTGRLRVAGDVSALGVDLLRFDAEQVGQVLEAHTGRSPDQEQIDRLIRLTEGWPASVALVAQTLAWLELNSLEQALADPRMKQDVYSYLAEQVYINESEATRRFLDRTCCLDHVTPALAARVGGIDDAHVHLNRLAVNHVFTFEAEPGAYRYHTLFREFLKHNYVHRHGEAALRALQVESADALEKAGSAEMAIELLFNANEPVAALEVLARAGESGLDSFPTESLVTWLQRLTWEMRTDEPWARLISSQVHIRSGQLEAALHDIERAVATCEAKADDWGLYHALSAREGVFFWMGDLDRQVQTCEEALAHAMTDAQRLHTLLSLGSAAIDRRDWPTVNTAFTAADALSSHATAQERARAQALRSLAAYTQGDYRAAIAGFPETPAGRLSPLLTISVLHTRGLVEIGLAQYSTALARFDEAQRVASQCGVSLAKNMLDDSVGVAISSQGRVDEGLAYVRRNVAYSRGTSIDPVLTAYALAAEGTILRRKNMLHEASECYSRASHLIPSERDPYLTLIVAANIAFTDGLAGSDSDSTLASISETATEAGLAYVSLTARLYIAILASEVDPEKARAIMRTVIPHQVRLGHLDLLCQELCPRRQAALLALHAPQKAADQIALLGALACHWDYPTLFGALAETEPGLIPDALAAACDHSSDEALSHVLAIAEQVRDPDLRQDVARVLARRPAIAPRPRRSSMPVLTRREYEVLRLMAGGLRNSDIASQLFLSNATVKTHVNHIFYKLGVSTRVQAILKYNQAEADRAPNGGSSSMYFNPRPTGNPA
jgi:LuxR family transcriptional regulator, maltose regulon positive regulatory protein